MKLRLESKTGSIFLTQSSLESSLNGKKLFLLELLYDICCHKACRDDFSQTQVVLLPSQNRQGPSSKVFVGTQSSHASINCITEQSINPSKSKCSRGHRRRLPEEAGQRRRQSLVRSGLWFARPK